MSDFLRSQANSCELMPCIPTKMGTAPPQLGHFSRSDFASDSQLFGGWERRFTTFGRCDSQLRGVDSQLNSQLLAGKRLEWRSLFRDRHSHGAFLAANCALITTHHLRTCVQASDIAHHIAHHGCRCRCPVAGPISLSQHQTPGSAPVLFPRMLIPTPPPLFL